MVTVDIMELALQERTALQIRLAEMDAFISMGRELMQHGKNEPAQPADAASRTASAPEDSEAETEPLRLWPNQALPRDHAESEESAGTVLRNLMRR